MKCKIIKLVFLGMGLLTLGLNPYVFAATGSNESVQKGDTECHKQAYNAPFTGPFAILVHGLTQD